MTIAKFPQSIFAGCLAFCLLSSSAQAEIYRWVDANGQTHYSERREDAGQAKAVELKGRPQPAPTQSANPSTPSWQEQERQFKERQIRKLNEKPAAATTPKSLSGGREDGTDASRCALARDVLNGAVRHRNGAPTDDYDRQVAENDVRTYCH